VESFESLDEISDSQEFSKTASPDLGELDGGLAEDIPGITDTPPELAPPASATKTMESIKTFSESMTQAPSSQAALPFTLRIEGKLSPQETEKLLDILSRENIGIREVDLEPQLEAGHILLPRISEYAGVLLIQALRGIQAKISFAPSDGFPGVASAPRETGKNVISPVADTLPVTQGEDLPQLGVYQILDTLIVSGLLSTRALEAANSAEYTSLTESLVRELKFKASRRGARGITHLTIQLTPLTLPTDYRVTVTGTAVH
jgi:hypothetical protein